MRQPPRRRTPPIRSRAQLQHYLHVTPLEQSPLGALSPGGRKRFLAMLVFTDRGLGSLSLADPANELDQSQIDALFQLFGASEFSTGVGLPAAEYARRHAERIAEADHRHCRLQSCPEVDGKRSDGLLLGSDEGGTDRERKIARGHAYDRLFAPWQTQAP